MNVFFSGIGGVGIGPLSIIAKDAGYEVAGSDTNDGLIIDELRKAGIVVNIGQDGSFLRQYHEKKPIDWFVYTSALPPDHPELNIARELGIRVSKRDEFLAELIKQHDLKLIAIAGTHGKTTTTGMMVWTMKQLEIPVSYSVGTTLSFGPSGAFDKNSQYFIYECDEYDKNFLNFEPFLSLVTSVDYDHPDTYPTQDDYLEAFRRFLEQSRSNILWRIDAERLGAIENEQNEVLDSPDVLDIALPGEHNRRNANLVVRALGTLRLGTNNQIVDALNSFPGTDRRFEKLAENLYSDYGHHPVEIAATIEMARELSDHVIVVYQPHQNRRQHLVKNEYSHAFVGAEQVYWLPTYLTREDPSQLVLTPEELSSNLVNRQDVHVSNLDDQLRETIQGHLARGDLVLCMGAGPIDNWVRKNLQQLSLAN